MTILKLHLEKNVSILKASFVFASFNPGIRFKFTGPNPICSNPRPLRLLTGEVPRSHVKVSIVSSILQSRSINNRGLVGSCLLGVF